MALTTDLTTREAVRAHYGAPNPRVLAKDRAALDTHARAFIALSPFVVIASSDAAGRADATPRGDAPGFVAPLDDATLLIPDRRGNNRVDTMMNVVENPRVGLVFMVPGLMETLRVNGRARIVTEPDLLAPLAAQGKVPAAGLLVAIEEVFFHCGKALIRSDLWNAERQLPRAAFPSLGRIMSDQLQDGLTVAEGEAWIAESYRDRLY